MSSLLVFTDLDGTLLDHHSYSFAPAQPALDELKARNIPLILVSSKTRAELEALQQQLNINTPFICENGAAVFWQADQQWQRQEFSLPRTDILQQLKQLRDQGFDFISFADCSVAQIAEMTGLSEAEADLASQRDYTEPLLWRGSEQSLEQFRQRLAANHLQAVQGGRFISVMGEFDKGTSLQWLRQRYEKDGPVTVVALGDSPNDEPMLNAADIAVVIRSQRSAELNIDKPAQCIYTDAPGPSGWQQAMADILLSL